MPNSGFVPGAIIGFILGCFAIWIAWTVSDNTLKSKAIETGAAEWVVDQKFGTTTFTWKEKK